MRSTDFKGIRGLVFSVLLAGFLLFFLLMALQNAALIALAQGPDDLIQAVVISSTLPFSDTRPGGAISRTVYFSNTMAGVITLTFEISGTPTLTLTAGAAFSNTLAWVYTSTSSTMPWSQEVTYSVATEHETQPNIVYTATDGVQTTTVVITYVRDITAPVAPMLRSPFSDTITNATTITFCWGRATDGDGSGVAGYNLKLDGTVFTISNTYSATVLSDGTYTWTVRAYDSVGNYGGYATERALIVDTRKWIYLPLVLRNYAPFANGSFENGWNPWGHDGELRQSLTQDDHAPDAEGQWSVLLGDPGYRNLGGVPVGSGRIWQTFSVPRSDNPEIIIWYRIYTHDVVWGAHTSKYYDSFEIYIKDVDWSEANNPDPGDTWRKTRCRDSLGVPDANNSGLVFCDGNDFNPSNEGPAKDLDWRSVTLNLKEFEGQNITLYLAIFNRVDGWYNTWIYIDDIQLTDG